MSFGILPLLQCLLLCLQQPICLRLPLCSGTFTYFVHFHKINYVHKHTMLWEVNLNMPNRWHNLWPGRGPYAHLPPWRRPGWLHRRSTCWWRQGLYQPMNPEEEITLLIEQKKLIEEQQKTMHEVLQKTQERIDQLKMQQ